MLLEAIRPQSVVNYKNFEQLPDCVVKYFRKVLRDGQPLIRGAHLRQAGEFRTSAKAKWKHFDAVETVSTARPGFSWNATIHMLRLLKLNVEDAYCNGEASMRVLIAGIPILKPKQDSRLAAAALQRFLAEAPWFPTALLPGPHLSWREIDKNHAKATLSDSGLNTSMYFEFKNNGEITGTFTPGRYQYKKGDYKLEPWGGYFQQYQNRNGILIPAQAEVEWLSPEENFCYYKGRVTEIQFNF